MTLKEIAEQANVSISTVSRVINQKKPAQPVQKFRSASGKLYEKAAIFPTVQHKT